jgi:hypothetical protein
MTFLPWSSISLTITRFPCHIIVGLFKTPSNFGVTFVEQVKVSLVEFNLTNKVIAYVKHEGINLNFLTTTFIFIVSCEPLQLPQLFVGFCFGHVMSKACQYAMNEIKVGAGMKELNLKDVQAPF